MEKEYESLRNEILSLMQKRDEYTLFAYTVTVAIWTAGFAIENAYIIFLGMFILVPIAVRVTDALYSSMRLAAYLSVFHEDRGEAKWETRNYTLRKIRKQDSKTILRYMLGRADFVLLEMMNAVIFWSYRGLPTFECTEKDVVLLAIQLLLIIIVILQCYRSAQVDRRRKNAIGDWKTLKKEEDKENEALCQTNP